MNSTNSPEGLNTGGVAAVGSFNTVQAGMPTNSSELAVSLVAYPLGSGGTEIQGTVTTDNSGNIIALNITNAGTGWSVGDTIRIYRDVQNGGEVDCTVTELDQEIVVNHLI